MISSQDDNGSEYRVGATAQPRRSGRQGPVRTGCATAWRSEALKYRGAAACMQPTFVNEGVHVDAEVEEDLISFRRFRRVRAARHGGNAHAHVHIHDLAPVLRPGSKAVGRAANQAVDRAANAAAVDADAAPHAVDHALPAAPARQQSAQPAGSVHLLSATRCDQAKC
eukprot:4045646-Pleurochrysis_carterae.AAC.2